MSEYTIYFDGLCSPNPDGVMTWAWHLNGPDGVEVKTGGGSRAPTNGNSCNVAEWFGLGTSLKHVAQEWRSCGMSKLFVHGDSHLVITQITGKWECNNPVMLDMRERCRRQLGQIAIPVEFGWLPRELNTRADELTRDIYRRLTGTEPKEYPRKGKRGK